MTLNIDNRRRSRSLSKKMEKEKGVVDLPPLHHHRTLGCNKIDITFPDCFQDLDNNLQYHNLPVDKLPNPPR